MLETLYKEALDRKKKIPKKDLIPITFLTRG